MKPIQKDEMFRHVSEFLQKKGVELKQGSYTRKIEKSCALLTDTINLSQRGLAQAKSRIERGLDQVRQVIHEKTAPKAPPAPASGANPFSAPPAPPRAAKPPGKKKTPRRRRRG
jgi:hypothetical protein